MVRACCVLNCTSSGTMPSHTFPKNPQMREKWMKNLILKSYKENEIHKLRICYQHFNESDYSGSCKHRRLIGSAVPFMVTQRNDIEQNENIQQNQETITVLQENVQLQEDASSQQESQQENITQIQRNDIIEQNESIQQNDETVTVLQENVTQSQEDASSQQESQQENITQIQIDQLSKQQKKQQDNLLQLQRNVEELYQVQAQHHHVLQEFQASKMQLRKVTRKKDLSPMARKLYETNVKVRAQNRRMKRKMNKLKQQNKVEKIILNARKNKDKGDRTRKIREGFLNMVVRNNDVPPQVHKS